MRGSLRAFWLDVNASYWFLPTLFTIAAFLLSIVTVYIDRTGGAAFLNDVAWLHPSRPDGARSQLTVIASAMISIASTVFAITIAAVAYASGTYGPRLLTNFMKDRGNQVSLAVFIATFVYNLMILRVVRSEQEAPASAEMAGGTALPGFVPQLSMLVSVVTLIVAVGVLVYFLHHVPASIRINSVLAGIGRRLVHDIEERFPEAARDDRPTNPIPGAPVVAGGIGYVEIIDFSALDEIAGKAGATIALKVRAGDFVHPHLPLAELAGTPLADELGDRIRDCFSLGSSRTPDQDLEFLIDELVEIALRALSPGINDPFTAVTSLHWMGAAIAELAARDLTPGPEQDSYDPDRVRPIADGFDHYLARSFGGVRPSAAGSPIAARQFLGALEGAAGAACAPWRRKALLEEARRLVRQAETALSGPSLDEVQAAFAKVEARLASS